MQVPRRLDSFRSGCVPLLPYLLRHPTCVAKGDALGLDYATAQQLLISSIVNGYDAPASFLIDVAGIIGSHGQPPLLHLAASSGCVGVATVMLNKGADIDALFDASRQGPLHAACIRGQGAVAMLLINRGAKRHIKDAYSCTPLDYCYAADGAVKAGMGGAITALQRA